LTRSIAIGSEYDPSADWQVCRSPVDVKASDIGLDTMTSLHAGRASKPAIATADGQRVMG
jgi:hypothetical protein